MDLEDLSNLAFEELLSFVKAEVDKGLAMNLDTLLFHYKELLKSYLPHQEDNIPFTRETLISKLRSECSHYVQVVSSSNSDENDQDIVVVSKTMSLHDSINAAYGFRQMLESIQGDSGTSVEYLAYLQSPRLLLFHAALLLRSALKSQQQSSADSETGSEEPDHFPVTLESPPLDEVYTFLHWVLSEAPPRSMHLLEKSPQQEGERSLHDHIVSVKKVLLRRSTAASCEAAAQGQRSREYANVDQLTEDAKNATFFDFPRNILCCVKEEVVEEGLDYPGSPTENKDFSSLMGSIASFNRPQWSSTPTPSASGYSNRPGSPLDRTFDTRYNAEQDQQLIAYGQTDSLMPRTGRHPDSPRSEVSYSDQPWSPAPALHSTHKELDSDASSRYHPPAVDNLSHQAMPASSHGDSALIAISEAMKVLSDDHPLDTCFERAPLNKAAVDQPVACAPKKATLEELSSRDVSQGHSGRATLVHLTPLQSTRRFANKQSVFLHSFSKDSASIFGDEPTPLSFLQDSASNVNNKQTPQSFSQDTASIFGDDPAPHSFSQDSACNFRDKATPHSFPKDSASNCRDEQIFHSFSRDSNNNFVDQTTPNSFSQDSACNLRNEPILSSPSTDTVCPTKQQARTSGQLNASFLGYSEKLATQSDQQTGYILPTKNLSRHLLPEGGSSLTVEPCRDEEMLPLNLSATNFSKQDRLLSDVQSLKESPNQPEENTESRAARSPGNNIPHGGEDTDTKQDAPSSSNSPIKIYLSKRTHSLNWSLQKRSAFTSHVKDKDQSQSPQKTVAKTETNNTSVEAATRMSSLAEKITDPVAPVDQGKQKRAASSQLNSLLNDTWPVSEAPWYCSLCRYKARTKLNLVRHLKRHLKHDVLQCRFCHYKTTKKACLDRHLNRHSRDNLRISADNQHSRIPSLKCPICSYEVKSRRTLKYHLNKHSKGKNFLCSRCTFYTSSEKVMLQHRFSVHSDNDVFQCSLCKFFTSTLRELHLHTKLKHDSENPFVCSTCEFETCVKEELQRHQLLAHSENQSHKCPECDFETHKKYHLNQHMLVHSKAEPYKCDQCDFESVRKSALQRHANIHLGMKPFHCIRCSYRTSRKDNLLTHFRRHVANANNRVMASKREQQQQ